MIRLLKLVALASFYETRFYLRHKEAFFFSLIFPTFLFILFGNIWGSGINGSAYITFLLSGILGMTIASDALFGIGPIVKIYNENGITKLLKSLPFNVMIHFFGVFASRIIAAILAIAVICMCTILVFDVTPSIENITTFIVGAIAGTFLFGFLGLTISFVFHLDMGKGILNFIYFPMLFLSGAFYPTDALPNVLYFFSYFLPLTHLIDFLRGEWNYIYIILGWIMVFMLVFYLVFNKRDVKR